MSLEGILLLALLWFVGSLLGQAGKKKQRQQGQQRPAPMPPREPRARTLPGPSRAPPRDTQAEGGKLEAWLRELERSLDQANAPIELPKPGRIGREPDVFLPSAEEVEERESLEIEPVAESRTFKERPAPEVVDLDLESVQAASRRLREASARNRALTAADHAEFDARIRRSPVPRVTKSPGSPLTPRLREAVIWSEILGQPKGWDA